MTQKKLTSLDEMFGAINKTDVTEIAISQLHPYHDHKFSLYQGERLDSMVDSIKTYGVLQPVIVRKIEDGYEILAGHNRTQGAKLAGLKAVPAKVIEADDKLAAEIVTETNLVQRSFNELKMSEKAKILEEHYNNIKAAGKRYNLIHQIEAAAQDEFVPQSRDEVGNEYNLTGRDVSRIMRINKLTDTLQKKVDNKEIAFNAAISLSFLDITTQIKVGRILDENKKNKVNLKNAAILRELEAKGELGLDTDELIESVLNGSYEKSLKEENKKVNDLPEFKNDKERKEFLNNYEAWGLWYEDKKVNARYYKYDLPDGKQIIAVRYKQSDMVRRNIYFKPNPDGYTLPEYHLVDEENPFSSRTTAVTYLIEHLRKIGSDEIQPKLQKGVSR